MPLGDPHPAYPYNLFSTADVLPTRDLLAVMAPSFPDWYIYEEMEEGGLLTKYKTLMEVPQDLKMQVEVKWRYELADKMIKERDKNYGTKSDS